MHYSGLLVRCKPSSLEACVHSLARHPHVDVYVTDRASGRIVIVLETETLEEQENCLRDVQRMPHVVTAELVYHYFGDEDRSPHPSAAAAERPAGRRPRS